MSKIQDLIDLKLMHSNGQEIYDLGDIAEYTDSYEAQIHSLLKQGIDVLERNEKDADPEIEYGYGEQSVTVNYNGTLFKSHRYSASYGREEWTEWREVKAIPIINYRYDESTY